MKRILFIASLVLFCTYPSHSADISADSQTEMFDDFSGGLVTELPSHKIIKSASPAMKNVMTDEVDGTIITRNGYNTLISTVMFNKITLITPYYKENGEKSYIVSDSSVVAETEDWISFTAIKTNLNDVYPLSAKQIWDKMWFTNGSDDVFNYDGSTVVVLNGTTYGTLKTPDVPTGKYIEEYQGRVFMAGINGNPSGLYMSNIVSTDAVVIAPDDFRAWPATNRLDISKGDGTNITGEFIEGGLLHIGKERSIHTIYGNDETNYQAVNKNPNVGIVSNLSIANVDGIVYFLGSDGINKFQNGIATRISDTIKTLVDDTIKNVAAIKSNDWERNTDFARGEFQKTTTTLTNNEILTIQTTYQWNWFNPENFNLTECWNFQVYAVTSTYVQQVGGENPQIWNDLFIGSVPVNYDGIISTISVETINRASGLGLTYASDLSVYITLKNKATNQSVTYGATCYVQPIANDNPKMTNFYLMDKTQPFRISGATIDVKNVQYKIDIDTIALSTFTIYIAAGNSLQISSFTKWGFGEIWISTNCGQYISDVATNSVLTFWDNFTAYDSLNGGSVKYYVKTGTSVQWVVNSTAQWKSILHNTPMNRPIHETYVQWAATINATNWNNPPTIDRVSILHNEGLSTSLRACGASWNNRYWILLSTYNDYSNPYILVKSQSNNPDAWMYFDGINVLTLFQFGNVFYGGSLTNGTLYLVDDWSNDNGTAIDAYYDTPDWTFGNGFTDKTFRQYLVDFEAGEADTIQIGTALNGGAITYKNLDASGSGRKAQAIYSVSGYGKTARFRFRCNELDKRLYLYGFGCVYQNTKNMSGATLK